jgi:solute carrier family 45 protein 1/2/4
LLRVTFLVVAVAAGSLLPHLAGRDPRLLVLKCDEDDHMEQIQLQATLHHWRAEAVQHGGPLRLPVMPFFLRDIWTGALILFAIITFSTFFISTVRQVCGLILGVLALC